MFIDAYFNFNEHYAFQFFNVELDKNNSESLPKDLIRINENKFLLGVSFKEFILLD